MKPVILIVQIIVAVGLIALIMLQSSKGGLGTAFGGGEFYRTKRGAERIVFSATILFGVLFLLTSILNLIIR
ncbi:preprotein translocase subunit SecG [Candidatus Gottesmanbacteria bacterium]|nr:preprotein translocase subunit SecG [Candidatus Gottesmanbacteria bacterium]